MTSEREQIDKFLLEYNNFNNISWKSSIIQLHDPKNFNQKGNFG